MSGAPDTWPLSAREAAAMLGVNERTVRRAITRGDLHATKRAGVYRIAPEALERYRARLAASRRETHLTPMERLLPVTTPLSRLVGREPEIAAASALLRRDDVRLVTLTGPGGVGKSRLALQIGEETGDDFDDVCFVPLAAVRNPELVLPSVAHRLGLHDTDGERLTERLLQSLHARRRLLILDNFEQIQVAAPLVVHLLGACTELKVMVTSRSLLHVTGEYVFPVPPLAVPPPTAVLSTGELSGYPAVRLFLDRARAVDPHFALTDDNASAVTELCRRLEGLPLGLELGAAWLRLLPPDALLSQMKRRLPLLLGGPTDQPERLRTMRDAIAWSYDLLPPDEQALFRRLAVFAGGVTLEGAAAVATNGASTADVLSGLASLVDASLLQRGSAEADHPRFVMLETIREYGLERLKASGEELEVRRRHAAWYTELAERANPELFGPQQARWLSRLEDEHDNLRTALAWADETSSGELLVRLAGALTRFWRFRSHLGEGQRWLDRAVTRRAGVSPTFQARALLGAGVMANIRGDYPRSAMLHEQALHLYEELGDKLGVARTLFYVAEAVDGQGDLDRARILYERSLARLRELGDDVTASLALKNLGRLARLRGDRDEATTHLEEALAACRAAGFAWGSAEVLLCLGDVALEQGMHALAARRLGESLALYHEQGDMVGVGESLAGIARAAAVVGRIEPAVRLFAAVTALREATGVRAEIPDDLEKDAAVEAMRTRFGEPTFAAAWAAGRALPTARVIADASTLAAELAAEPPASHDAREAPVPNVGLSEREAEVLRLVAQGLTNRQVAGQLYLSPRTVEAHLQRIYAKLDVSSRGAAIRIAVEQGLT